jgi:hypothetical protein
MRRDEPVMVPQYGPYTCWLDVRGLHFVYNSGWSGCSHIVKRRRARAFLRSLGLPVTIGVHDVLRSFTYEEWKNLHEAIHALRES